jgi:hypothetical protein
VRAAELASRCGAYGEALTCFQNALELAGDTERIVLYEELGDSLMPRHWSATMRDAYRQGLDLWHQLPGRQLHTGARLTRKLLICQTRWKGESLPSAEELAGLLQEGLLLAGLAGDAYETGRLRAASTFMITDLHLLPLEEMRQSQKVRNLKQLAIYAASYFEEHRTGKLLARCSMATRPSNSVAARIQRCWRLFSGAYKWLISRFMSRRRDRDPCSGLCAQWRVRRVHPDFTRSDRDTATG